MIYLDYSATTPIDPRVLEAMMPYLTEVYANASSTHTFGLQAKEAVDHAREQIAGLIGSEKHEIVFTSGATEGINIAMKGIMAMNSRKGKHLITVETEHTAVLDTAKFLEKEGYEVTYLPVDSDGLVDPQSLKEAIRPDTVLVSIMYVNNETGVIQPIKELAYISHEAGALFMTDGTQAVGKLPISVEELGIDIMPFSGHKIYAPKGIGALYVRSKRPNRVRLQALQHGGGHEKGMRSGTLNVAGIVALGKACEVAKKDMQKDAQNIGAIRDELEKQLLEIPNAFVNGSTTQRLYNVTNICFEGVDADAMIVGLKDIALSNGSACTSTSVEPSHVLIAMGKSPEQAFSSLRLSLGRKSKPSDIAEVVGQIGKQVEELRSLVGSLYRLELDDSYPTPQKKTSPLYSSLFVFAQKLMFDEFLRILETLQSCHPVRHTE